VTTHGKDITRSRSEAVFFTVEYPWGGNYTTRLRRALQRLGFRTLTDQFDEGSDVHSFFLATERRSIEQGRRIIKAYGTKVDNDEVDLEEEAWDRMILELVDVGVYEVVQDWKYLDWHSDQHMLRSLGIGLSVRRRARDLQDNDVFECTLRRTLMPGRRQR